jgi:NAD(P)-dependent dehydrogenase (short-subunit alcohol dehydrogenase family)
MQNRTAPPAREGSKRPVGEPSNVSPGCHKGLAQVLLHKYSSERVASFGADVPMQRAGQPEEVAPSYVFLASDDASYMTGQILHPNGGEVVNG